MNYFSKFKTQCFATIVIAVLAISCKEEESTVAPAKEEVAAECGTTITMTNRTCPNNRRCGCYTVAGLAARKQFFLNNARTAAGVSLDDAKEFVGKAMLETNNLNANSYPYGDVYPNRASEPWATRDRKKTGYAANYGAMKQNIFVYAATINGAENTVVSNVVFDNTVWTTNGAQQGDFKPSACPATATCWNEIVDLGNANAGKDLLWFVQSRNRLRVLFSKASATQLATGYDPFARVHRGGSSYITNAYITSFVGNPVWVKTQNDALGILVGNGSKQLWDAGWTAKDEGASRADTWEYQKATDWIESNLFGAGHSNDDIKFWAELANI